MHTSAPTKHASQRAVAHLSLVKYRELWILQINFRNAVPPESDARDRDYYADERRGGLTPKLWRNSTSPIRQAIALREKLKVVLDRSRKILWDIIALNCSHPKSPPRRTTGEHRKTHTFSRSCQSITGVREVTNQPRRSGGADHQVSCVTHPRGPEPRAN